MMTSTTFFVRTSLCLAMVGALTSLGACDLPDKNLGDDPGASTGDDPGTCEPGETKMEDCNTCSCEGGQWACTEIACADSGDDPITCDPADEPVDECNTCSCEDGLWVCTTMACDPTTGADECDPATEPGDGCTSCFCEEGEWICTGAACPDTAPVAVCDGTEPSDLYFVNAASISVDTLLLTLSYGGGCEPHIVTTCWDQSFDESSPVQTSVQINHESNDDPCEAELTEEFAFDLAPLREAWIDAYQQPNGTMIVHVPEWGALEYTF